jgi:L-amino acid N-acyltransferase YncA
VPPEPSDRYAPVPATAQAADASAIEALLSASALPTQGVPEQLANFVVVRDEGQRLLACAGWEACGDGVLLRSVAVAEPGGGLGKLVLRAALDGARKQGARWAVLRTTTAADFFALSGFRPIAAAQVPAAALGSAQFQGLCPEDASTMLLDLSTGLSVRASRQDDMVAVLDIYNHEVRHSTATYQYAERALEEQVAQWQTKHADRHGFFVAETEAGEVVGYSNYGLFRPREGWRFCCEHSVYIHPEWRGRGVGKMLLPPVMAHARRRGFHAMVGVVDASNAASIKLHETLGFAVAGVIKQGGFKFDRWLDVAFVQAML